MPMIVFAQMNDKSFEVGLVHFGPYKFNKIIKHEIFSAAVRKIHRIVQLHSQFMP
jgi:hypothetical protein